MSNHVTKISAWQAIAWLTLAIFGNYIVAFIAYWMLSYSLPCNYQNTLQDIYRTLTTPRGLSDVRSTYINIEYNAPDSSKTIWTVVISDHNVPSITLSTYYFTFGPNLPIHPDKQGWLQLLPGAYDLNVPYWTYAKQYNSGHKSQTDGVIVVDSGFGWPYLSLRYRSYNNWTLDGISISGAVLLYPLFGDIYKYITGRFWPYGNTTPDTNRVFCFPLIPIWRGFLLNSLVYLCMIGFADLAILRPTWRHAGRPALRSLRSWRRRRRIIKLADRRGLCPNCKHPLVPAATDPATGTTSPRRCTECGWSDATPPPAPQPAAEQASPPAAHRSGHAVG